MPNRGPRFNPAFVGLISAAIMFGLLFFAFTNVTLFASTLDVKAQVASADTLQSNADVEVAGVKVGLVKSVDKGDPGALLDMTVDTKKVTIYKDATLLVRPHGVFGPKFVALDPGSPGSGDFPTGGTVPLANTKVSVDLEQVFNELDTNTRQSLQTVLYELGTGATNRGADFGTVIDQVNVVETQLTPVLVVIDNRQFETGRLLESSAVVNETLAASPFDQIIKKNADVLTKLDAANTSVTGVVVHGNNVLVSLDTITGGSNTQALATVISQLPSLMDHLQIFQNDLGYGVNAILPEITPQHGQALSDLGLAVNRTQDAFGQCDISNQTAPTAADTVHANIVKIVPCYSAPGVPFTNASGQVAHHHVNVLLGLHSNPKAPALATLGTIAGPLGSLLTKLQGSLGQVGTLLASLNVEEEGAVVCGPNSGNITRPTGTSAFNCKTDPLQSAPIRGAGGPPPPLFSGVAGTGTAAAPVIAPAVSTSAMLPNSSRGLDILVALALMAAGAVVGFRAWRIRRV